MTHLIRFRGRGFDKVMLCESLEAGQIAGRAWVGEHSLIDGCSTKPYEQSYVGGRWSISRSSSFGDRSCWIYPQEPGTSGRFDII